VNEDAETINLAARHADLLTRLASGGDPTLLRRLCQALGAARDEGDVCVDLIRWCREPATEDDHARPAFDEARRSLLATGVVATEADETLTKPLVLDEQGCLYTLRHYRAEQKIARFVSERLERPPLRTPAEVRSTLAALSLLPHDDRDEPDWQLAAVVAGSTRAVTVLCGGPGTGKTTTVAKLMSALLHAEPALRVALAAPTGKAAARLGEALAERATEHPELSAPLRGLEPQTIHRLLGYLPLSDEFRYGRDRQVPYDLVVIDEASMVDPAIFAALCEALAENTRLILVGDKNQLAAVAAGQVLGDLTRAARPESGLGNNLAIDVRAATGMDVPTQVDAAPIADVTVSLSKNHRFGKQPGIGAFSKALVERDSPGAMSALRHGHDDLALKADPEAALRDFLPQLERLLEAAVTGDAERALAAIPHARVLTAQRLGPTSAADWNQRIEQRLAERGHRIDEPYYVGRPVLVTANDQGNRIWNGDLGVCGRSTDGSPVVWIRDQNGKARTLNPRRLPAHETAWAMTVHKSQGSEFDHVLLALPNQTSPLNHASLIYTGVTRARRRATICADEALLLEGLENWPARQSGLARALSVRPK